MGGNGRYVLVVEDDDIVRHLLTALLEDEGYRVAAVTNGAAALQLLAEATAADPQVILLDMWMPVMDGREFIATYHRRPGRHAPIIAMTGAFFATPTEAAPQVDELLTKPFDLDQLLALVRRHAQPPALASRLRRTTSATREAAASLEPNLASV